MKLQFATVSTAWACLLGAPAVFADHGQTYFLRGKNLCVLENSSKRKKSLHESANKNSWSPYLVGAGIGVLSWFAFATADRQIGITTADWGKVTLPQITGTSPWIWVVAVVVVIGIALVWLERRHPRPQTTS